MLTLIPRRYRALGVRVIFCFIFGILLLQLLPSHKQVSKGSGRSDKSLFRFEHDLENDKENDESKNDKEEVEIIASDDGIIHELPLPPSSLRGEDGSDLIQDSENITEEVVPEPSYDYYAESELEPHFRRPAIDPSLPGELGKPYKLSEEEESNEETQRAVKRGWNNHAFNHFVCDKISVHRSLPDRRDKECKFDKKGEIRKWRKPLPTTSVIIIFHNEAWCALLRTIHSVIETSPASLLKEIILVDDCSTNDNLKKPLDDYISKLKIVRVIRLPKRSGLIQARLVGAEAAIAEVLTFLDSHCECAPYWLEPLLEGIAQDPKRVVCPVIEVIDADNFAVSTTTARSVQRGVVSWSLVFGWSKQKPETNVYGNEMWIDSPTMAGGLFSIDKKYFNHIGTYDGDMKVWGGENIEMSFRIWMCGGSIQINACSHVGHIFRKYAPYTHPGGTDVIIRNNKRLAEVWMDEYKEEYYKRVPKARNMDVGDLSDRFQLRKDLQCEDFQWYLTNIYPELYAPPKEDIILNGEWRNKGKNGFCLDSQNPSGISGKRVAVYPCHKLGSNQDFTFTRQNEIRHNFVHELCLQAIGNVVVTQTCVYPLGKVPIQQQWKITEDGKIQQINNYKCLDVDSSNSLWLLPCQEDKLTQKWIITKLTNL